MIYIPQSQSRDDQARDFDLFDAYRRCRPPERRIRRAVAWQQEENRLDEHGYFYSFVLLPSGAGDRELHDADQNESRRDNEVTAQHD